MAIRHGLLALLDEGPAYGYQLKAAVEERTGGTWLLNIGQVYTTLARAERDGLVAALEADDEGRVVYEITESGRRTVRQWFSEPVRHEAAPRDELAIKLAVAVTAPDVDVRAIVSRQRTETMRELQDLTRLKMRAVEDADARAEDGDERATSGAGADLAWLLVLDRLIFDLEAEARWLDHCESRIARAAASANPSRRRTSTTSRASQGSAR
jgi:DNA-binding PadR family transcriptional regulator